MGKSAFQESKTYTRKQVWAALGKTEAETKGGAYATGYAWVGDTCVVFANVGVAGRTGHDYANTMVGSEFIWWSKSNRTLASPEVKKIISGSGKILVFYRTEDRDPWTYWGEAAVKGTPTVEAVVGHGSAVKFRLIAKTHSQPGAAPRGSLGLSAVWIAAVERISKSMDSPTYMPVAVMAAMRLIQRGEATAQRIPYELLRTEFQAVHADVDGTALDKAYLPFFHLSVESSVWQLVDQSGSALPTDRDSRPKSPGAYAGRGITARFSTVLCEGLDPGLVIEAMERLLPAEDDDGEEGPEVSGSAAKENAKRLRTHLVRERRSSGIKKEMLADLIKLGRSVVCEACGFHYREIYGADHDFIEAHHRSPLSSNDVERVTTKADLALLCANCHRAIHRIRPEVSVEQLAAMLGRAPIAKA